MNLLTKKKYQVIYADPPWKYRDDDDKLVYSHGDHGDVSGLDLYYKTMYLKDIKKLKIPADKNCWLLLWATATKLPEALEVLEAWGFKYWTCAIWDKVHLGLGWFFRVQHEILLIGKKGKPKLPIKKVRSIFIEKRTIHSKKPECVIKYIEKAFPNKSKIELFARKRRKGWDSWGDEIR